MNFIIGCIKKKLKKYKFVKWIYFHLIAKHKIKGIDKDAIDDIITKQQFLGLNTKKRDVPLIVSLTSWPPRIYEVYYTIVSLLNQSYQPDEIVLWLAVEEFPNKEADLPDILLQFKEYGLTIKWCDNLRSYKKLIPALKEYKNAIIVTVDDDTYYPKDMLLTMYHSHQEFPKDIIANRIHRIKLSNDGKVLPYLDWEWESIFAVAGYRNFFTGVGGVLYPPHSLYADVDKVDQYMRLAPNADDIWFWAMAVVNETKVRFNHGIKNSQFLYVNPYKVYMGEACLSNSNVEKNMNDVQMQQVLNAYPLVLERIRDEQKKE